jgi:hypothetical protein
MVRRRGEKGWQSVDRFEKENEHVRPGVRVG